VQVAQATDFPKGQSSTIFVAADAPEGDAPKVAALQKQVLAVDGVNGVSPPAYLGKDTWSFDVYTKQLFYDAAALDAVADLRSLDSAAPIKVGGNSAVFVDQRATILDRVPLALLLILAITFVVLFLMTGSVVLPLKTFIMNIFTLAATFGILTWIFGEGHLEGVLGYTSQNALEMTQPVLLFVIAFALATDYGVFLLGRIKELRDQGLDNHESVAQGVAKTGRVITSAALLFCVAIGAFSLSGIVFIKQLGIGTALAVAIDATLIRALLVPALMAMLGEYNWWAPRWMKRIYERFGLSEGPSAPEPKPAIVHP
jgi:RND superfamily putative drug exporter